jgi:trehalose/maltose transport system permease protein
MTTIRENRPKPDKKSASFSELAKQEERMAYFLLIPTFVILIVIAFYPLGSVFYASFTDRTFASAAETQFTGLQNYKNLLGLTIKPLEPVLDEDTGQPVVDPQTGEVEYERSINVLPRTPVRYREISQFSLFGNRYVIGAADRDFMVGVRDTLLFTIVSVIFETILGLGVALVVHTSFPGRGLMRAVMLIPWAIPTAISSRMWEWMFQPSRVGLFNTVGQMFGLTDGNFPFLQNEAFQIPAMIAIDVWKTTPFMALLLLAGLQLIPGELYEAADVDGASRLRQFWSVTLPLLRPTLAVALIFRTLDALRVFDLFQIVLAQSRYSMASFSYYQLINTRAMGYSSAASVVIFILIFIFALIYIRMLGVDSD